MSWDRVEGKWKQERGRAKRSWAKMMNDDLAAVSGRYDELVGMLQEKYGIVNEEAIRQVQCFRNHCAECRQKTADRLKKSNKELTELRKAVSEKKKGRKNRSPLTAPARKRGRMKKNGKLISRRGRNV
jgi:uncharacterized protein YjbJ (UPF0337 family)